MQEDWNNYDFDVTLNIDGTRYDVGVNIISKGTIYLETEEEWLTDPPGYPPVSMGHYISRSVVEETPEWKIVRMDIYGDEGWTEVVGPEEVNSYMTLNPDKKRVIEEYVEQHCKQDLADDAIDYGDSTDAYDVHISD